MTSKQNMDKEQWVIAGICDEGQYPPRHVTGREAAFGLAASGLRAQGDKPSMASAQAAVKALEGADYTVGRTLNVQGSGVVEFNLTLLWSPGQRGW